MEFFSKLLKLFTQIFQSNNDPTVIMPIEICEIILRKLDPKSLLNAAQVSKRFLNICRNDAVLKTTARHYLRKQKNDLFNVGKLYTHRFAIYPNQRTKTDKNIFHKRKTMSYYYNNKKIIQSKNSLISIANNKNYLLTEKRMLLRFR